MRGCRGRRHPISLETVRAIGPTTPQTAPRARGEEGRQRGRNKKQKKTSHLRQLIRATPAILIQPQSPSAPTPSPCSTPRRAPAMEILLPFCGGGGGCFASSFSFLFQSSAQQLKAVKLVRFGVRRPHCGPFGVPFSSALGNAHTSAWCGATTTKTLPRHPHGFHRVESKTPHIIVEPSAK